jgi:3-oxoacyl-[acyl-carrier protein] reductase
MDVTVTASYPSLKGRVAIVTGGGQGIGRGFSHYFAAHGAIPVIAELNGENGRRVQREIEAKGGKALAIETDVGSKASVDAMAAAALKAYGRIDCLLNNAAVFSRITMAPFWELPVDEWERAMQVNINGAFYCSRAVVPAMQEAKWGRILNFTSGTVATGAPNYLHYITSKSAIRGMTRSMARELGPWNITVNTFLPGVTKTEVPRPSVTDEQFARFAEVQCIHRLATIEDSCKLMMFMCSDEAAFVTGQIVQADGGLSFS